MTQFVAKGAESVSVLFLAAADALRRVGRLPDALAHAIEKFAVGK